MRQFLATESPLKKMKKGFYFTSKALFVLKIFKLLAWLFGHVSTSWIKKIKLLSNFMTSQPGEQIIVIHMLPNISRSKDNETMKFAHLIDCNIRNIFLEKSSSKRCGETSPRPFSKKLKLSISLDQWSKVLYSLFLLYGKLKAIEIY